MSALGLAWSVLTGCQSEPEASASEKKYNPQVAEDTLSRKYTPQVTGSQNVVTNHQVLYPSDIFHPTEINTAASDYTVKFETPGLKSASGLCEVKSVTIRKQYSYSSTSSWNYYQDQDPVIIIEQPQTPAPQVPYPQQPEPQEVPLPQEQQQGPSNSDMDGFLFGVLNSPAEAGWEQAVSVNGPLHTWTFSADFYYNGTFCSATQTRKSLNSAPSADDWKVRSREMSCTSMPAKTEDGLSGERQVADCLGAALSGH